MGDVQRIPMLDLGPEIHEQWDELTDAIQRVLRSGQFILGPEVEAFEREVAEYLGVKHAIGVNSGTDALVIGLRALGIGPGDEVITTPFTFFATAEAVSNVGATPVFVDIDERTFNIDPELIEPAITERTRAIIPVHLFGLPCEMDPILSLAERYDLKVLEDVAQAMGATYRGRKTGTLGDAAAFSFFPSKTLGAFGDAGLVVTSDDEVAALSRMLRTHGSKRKYENELLGYNSRLDDLQAAILRIKLRLLDTRNEARREAAERYRMLLSSCELLALPSDSTHGRHVYHQFTVRVSRTIRDQLVEHLRAGGIGSMVYYPRPLHLMPMYETGGDLSQSEVAAQEVISIPISSNLDKAQQELIVCSLIERLRTLEH